MGVGYADAQKWAAVTAVTERNVTGEMTENSHFLGYGNKIGNGVGANGNAVT